MYGNISKNNSCHRGSPLGNHREGVKSSSDWISQRPFPGAAVSSRMGPRISQSLPWVTSLWFLSDCPTRAAGFLSHPREARVPTTLPLWLSPSSYCHCLLLPTVWGRPSAELCNVSSVLQAPPASCPRLLLAEEMSRRRGIKPVPSVSQRSKN